MNSGGTAAVFQYGDAIDTTVSSGGTQIVYPGAVLASTTVDLGGSIEVVQLDYAPGGTASVTAGDVLSVTVGSKTYTQQLTGDYAGEAFQINSAAYPAGAIVLTLEQPSTISVTSRETSSGITLHDPDVLIVLSGGTALSTTVDSGGTEYVSSGGRASFTTISNGGMEYVLSSGATVSDTIVSSGGFEVVQGGGTAVDTTVAMNGSIVLLDVTSVSGETVSLTSDDVLSITVGDLTYTQQLAGVYTGDESFQFTSGPLVGTQVTLEGPCYRSGTRIQTDRGEVAVEDLRVGDLVHTVLEEATAPIIWIGQRDVDCARHPTPRKVWPVRVAAGAFGPGRPHTELFLSPDHAVYVEGVLIPVRHLLNGSTIVQVPMDRISYYHFELPRHAVVLAQGLPAESFLDLKDGSNYPNRPGPVRLYPDYTARMWEAFGCARLVVTGPELLAARALVDRFAQARHVA